MSTTPQLDFSKAQPIPQRGADLDFTKAQPIGEGSSPSGGESPRLARPEAQGGALSDLVDMGKLLPALIHAKLLGTDPGLTYNHADEIEKQLSAVASDFKSRVDKATTVADDPISLAIRRQVPAPFESHDMLEDVLHSASEFIADPVMYMPAVIGAFAGPAGAQKGANIGFALDAGLRKMLMDGIQKGDIKGAGDLFHRAADTLWATAKGYAAGKAMEFGGKIPAGGIPYASAALKVAYQAAAVDLVGSLLEGQVPTLRNFASSAATVGLFESIMHVAGKTINTKQGLMDNYAKNGTHPKDAVEHLQVQPPVKDEVKAGLQPAIRLTAKDGSKQVISGDYNTHSDLAENVAGTRPVGIDELEADPKLADKVLSQPEIHEQGVVDRAYELKAESGEATTDIPPKGDLKSGRGFVTSSGDYLNRSQAKKWVKENEPEVYEMWKQVAGGEKDIKTGKPTEFHTTDYKAAVDRMNGLDLVEGETNYRAMNPENVHRIISNRKGLTDAKASLTGESKRGKSYEEELRTFVIGQKDLRTAIANDLRSAMRDVLPDEVDRQALTLMRDYKGNEQELRYILDDAKDTDVGPDRFQTRLNALKERRGVDYDPDEIGTFEESGAFERIRNIIPVIEKALAPTDQMKSVDAELTKYAESTLEEARSLGILDSSIPPDKYVTHILREADAEEARGGLGRPKLATSTPYGKQRTYPTTIDAMIAGKVPRTLDALDSIVIYGDRHATAVATRLFATELKNTELGKMFTGKQIPSGWKKVGEGKLFEYTIVNPKTGKPFTTALYAPAKIADAMIPITERKTLFQSPAGQKFRDIQSRLKAGWVGLAVFHGNALTHSAINNMGIDILKLRQEKLNSPEFRREMEAWAADGLITAITRTPYEVYRGLEGVTAFETPSRMDVVRNIYGIDKLNELAAKVTHGTFDVLQTFYKVPDASFQLAAWEAKNPNATKSEYFAARRSIAKEVNAVYGGLNWEALGWRPNSVELLRAIMLAPDWSFSNVYSMKYAMPKSLGGEGGNPGGKAARMFWFRSATNGLALTQVTSLLLTGQLSKNPTQVYLGNDDKGKEIYAQIFFAGAPKDFVTQLNAWHRDGAVVGTAEFLSYKLGPLVGTGFKAASNRDWSGKPIIKKPQSATEKTIRGAGFVAGELVPAPFAVKTAAQMITDPDKDYTYKDFLLGLAGAPVYHRAPEGSKGGQIHLQGAGSGRGKFHLKGAR